MNRTEIATLIKSKSKINISKGWIFILEVEEGPATMVTINHSGTIRRMWIGEVIDLIQDIIVAPEAACKKCKGTGIVQAHIRVEGGRCYRCGGSGVEADYHTRKREEKERAAYEKTDEYKAKHAEYLREMRKGRSLYF